MSPPKSHSSNAAPVALVTGASRGLGRGIALALARDGKSVAVHYASNRAAADETVAECQKLATQPGQRFVAVGGDIGDSAARARIVAETTAAFGRIDALINNAGIAPRVRADIVDATEESFDEVIGINLKGPYFLSQAVVRSWLERPNDACLPGGYKLIFVSSISAYLASINRGEYCISKAGLAMATKLWASRLAADGIQVFEIRPGIMATDMTAGVKEKYDALIAGGLVPQRRWGTGDDVGQAVIALLAGSFPFSTGDVFNVDGGMHLQRL